jgi:hypothetical protein
MSPKLTRGTATLTLFLTTLTTLLGGCATTQYQPQLVARGELTPSLRRWLRHAGPGKASGKRAFLSRTRPIRGVCSRGASACAVGPASRWSGSRAVGARRDVLTGLAGKLGRAVG